LEGRWKRLLVQLPPLTLRSYKVGLAVKLEERVEEVVGSTPPLT